MEYDEGYQVTLAAGGEEGLAAIAAHQPQVMLLDLNMPQFSGWDVCHHLQAQHIRVPTVIMTAGLGIAAEAARLNAAASLAKPFDLDDLLSTIRQCLASSC